jgi:hypothetical protein
MPSWGLATALDMSRGTNIKLRTALRKKLRKYPGLNTPLGIPGVFFEWILDICIESIRIHRVFPTGYLTPGIS